MFPSLRVYSGNKSNKEAEKEFSCEIRFNYVKNFDVGILSDPIPSVISGTVNVSKAWKIDVCIGTFQLGILRKYLGHTFEGNVEEKDLGIW